MPETKLKPCPFCGNKNITMQKGVYGSLQMFVCENPDCFATVSFHSKHSDTVVAKAVEAWNRRADNV